MGGREESVAGWEWEWGIVGIDGVDAEWMARRGCECRVVKIDGALHVIDAESVAGWDCGWRRIVGIDGTLCAVDAVVFRRVADIVAIVVTYDDDVVVVVCDEYGASGTVTAAGDGAGLGGRIGADSGAVTATECGNARIQC